MKTLVAKWIFSLALAFAAEDVKVLVSVDRDEVSVGDVLTLQVGVESSNSSNVEPPDIEKSVAGVQVVGTSSGFETRSSFENGRFITQQQRVFYYQLVPTQKGKLKIPPLTVTVDGRPYKTQPREISVADGRPGQNPTARKGNQTPDPFDSSDDMEELFQQMVQRHFGPGAPGGAPGGKPSAPPAGFNENEAFHIVAEVDKKHAFVGEQITANFYLLTRGQVRDIDTLRYPDLKGFWKEDLEMATRLNFENVTINGQSYMRALLVSYALFPIKAGKVTVDPYKAKCTVIMPSTFGFGRPYSFTKASLPVVIDVEDVPQTRPANYTGAVGNFRVSAAFEPPTGSVNQPVTLRVRFEGQGNAKLIELPKLELPPTFELYDQKSQAKYLKDGTSFKEFEVLIIPREGGIFKIPPVGIAVFDPQSRKFTEVASQPLNLTVTGAAGAPQPQAQLGDKTPGTGPVVNKEPSLPALATEIGEVPKGNKPLVWATSVAYLSVLAFLLLLARRRLGGKPKKASLKIVLKNRLARVRELKNKNEWRRVGVELTNAAYYVLGQVSELGGANQDLSRLLERTPPSLRHELAQPIRQLLAQCEALSFAPENLVSDMSQKGKLDELLKEFERTMSRAIELADV